MRHWDVTHRYTAPYRQRPRRALSLSVSVCLYAFHFLIIRPSNVKGTVRVTGRGESGRSRGELEDGKARKTARDDRYKCATKTKTSVDTPTNSSQRIERRDACIHTLTGLTGRGGDQKRKRREMCPEELTGSSNSSSCSSGWSVCLCLSKLWCVQCAVQARTDKDRQGQGQGQARAGH